MVNIKVIKGSYQDDALAEVLDRFTVDQGCVNVDIMIEQYDKYLSDLLDRHAPKKNIHVVDRPLNEWMTDDILTLKAIHRKNELIWRKTRTTINFDTYYDSCKAVKKYISKRKSELMEQRVIDCEGDQKKWFLSYILYLGVKRIQCCQNIRALSITRNSPKCVVCNYRLFIFIEN